MGSVGIPLPGTGVKIVDPETLEELPASEDDLILIGNCQVMQGYLKAPEKTAEVIAEIDGLRWYKTGDKGHLDKDGFLTIVDRYSRFAKIGGEMVSLTSVEAEVRKAMDDPELEVVAVALEDEKKGEKVILLSTIEIDLLVLSNKMKTLGCNPLMLPHGAYQVENMPILGSGKTNFTAAKKLAL